MACCLSTECSARGRIDVMLSFDLHEGGLMSCIYCHMLHILSHDHSLNSIPNNIQFQFHFHSQTL